MDNFKLKILEEAVLNGTLTDETFILAVKEFGALKYNTQLTNIHRALYTYSNLAKLTMSSAEAYSFYGNMTALINLNKE